MIYVIGSSTLIAILTSSYQLYDSYQRDITKIDTRFDEIEITQLSNISSRLWNYDDEGLRVSLKSILVLDTIQYLEVRDNNTLLVALGEQNLTNSISKEYPLMYSSWDKQQRVGTMIVHASLDDVYQHIYDQALVIVVGNTIKTFIVSGVILFVFFQIIGRHLISIVQFAENFSVHTIGNKLELNRKPSKPNRSDELDHLVSAIDTMQNRINRAVEDVTARKETELQLETILNTAPEAIISINQDNTVIVFNNGAERIFGYKSNEVIGQPIDMLLPERAHHNDHNFIEAFSRSGEKYALLDKHGGISGLRKDGTQFPASVSLSRLELRGEKVFTVMLHDNTNLKLAEAQLIQSSKLASLGEMATGIAHEINQPLNIIRMASDTLVEMVEEGEVPTADVLTKKLERINSQINRASDIIDRMRIFGRTPLDQATKISPKDAVLGAISFLIEHLRLSNIEMKPDIPETCRPVLGDFVQLEQVALNLLSNAYDAIKGKALVARDDCPEHISVTVEDDITKPFVRLIVEDTGGGIPENILPKTFDPFFTSKTIGKGTGVGLSISYGIIAEMGGTITAKNSGGGAVFTVTLPVATDMGLNET